MREVGQDVGKVIDDDIDDEKDDVHRMMMEVEQLLGASGYRTRRNILMTHGEYPCNCLVQTLWYPKR